MSSARVLYAAGRWRPRARLILPRCGGARAPDRARLARRSSERHRRLGPAGSSPGSSTARRASMQQEAQSYDANGPVVELDLERVAVKRLDSGDFEHPVDVTEVGRSRPAVAAPAAKIPVDRELVAIVALPIPVPGAAPAPGASRSIPRVPSGRSARRALRIGHGSAAADGPADTCRSRFRRTRTDAPRAIVDGDPAHVFASRHQRVAALLPPDKTAGG